MPSSFSLLEATILLTALALNDVNGPFPLHGEKRHVSFPFFLAADMTNDDLE